MQNLISKYLIYALGEIILVVIGILIALQINTWNQKRLLQKEETQYLKQIIGDLELDLQTLRSVQYNYELKLVLGKEVLETLGSDNVKNLQKRPGFERALAQKARYGAI
jgi:sensor domain CHASE-containing protein